MSLRQFWRVKGQYFDSLSLIVARGHRRWKVDSFNIQITIYRCAPVTDGQQVVSSLELEPLELATCLQLHLFTASKTDTGSLILRIMGSYAFKLYIHESALLNYRKQILLIDILLNNTDCSQIAMIPKIKKYLQS